MSAAKVLGGKGLRVRVFGASRAGAVPAAGAEPSSAKSLREDGTWSSSGGGGSGDVVGPASSVDSELALFSGTTGKLIKRAAITGLAKLTSGVLSAVTTWTGAGLTGTASRLASFDGSGNPSVTAIGTGASDVAAGDALPTHVGAADPHSQYALESALGTASLLDASTTPAASGLLQLDAYGWLGMSAVLASWRYAASFASFVNNATSGYGFSISVAGTSTTPSTSAYSHRYATANCGWFVSARLASRTVGFAYALIFKLPTSVTSRRLWIGLGSTTMSDSDTAAGEFVGARYSGLLHARAPPEGGGGGADRGA